MRHRIPGQDAPLEAQAGHQLVQRFGAHVRFALPVELHVGRAAVGPVPEQHPVAAGGQRFGQWPQPLDLLAEPPAWRQGDEIAFLAEDFVYDVATVDLEG